MLINSGNQLTEQCVCLRNQDKNTKKIRYLLPTQAKNSIDSIKQFSNDSKLLQQQQRRLQRESKTHAAKPNQRTENAEIEGTIDEERGLKKNEPTFEQ